LLTNLKIPELRKSKEGFHTLRFLEEEGSRRGGKILCSLTRIQGIFFDSQPRAMEVLGRNRRRSKGKAGSPSGLHPLELDGGGLTTFNEGSDAGAYDVENEQLRNQKGRESLSVGQQAGTPGKKGSRGARNCSRSPWSCSVCTLDNRAENDECEACLNPRIGDAEKMDEGGESKSPYGQNDSEAGPSSVPASGGPEWACTLCTFANRFEAMECEACSQRRPFEAPAADSKANPDAQTAQRNTVELELLGRQDAPADADGLREVDVTESGRGESSESAVETKRLAKGVEGAAGETQQAANQLEHNLLQELAGKSVSRISSSQLLSQALLQFLAAMFIVMVASSSKLTKVGYHLLSAFGA
jgi:hypothetical protein